MLMPMINPDLPPYQLPGAGPGESEVHRLRREHPDMFRPSSPHAPSNTHYYVSHQRTGETYEVLPPIRELLGPAISPVDWPRRYTAGVPPTPQLPPPPGIAQPTTFRQALGTAPTPTANDRLPADRALVTTQESHPPSDKGAQSRAFHLTAVLLREKNEGTKAKPKMACRREQCGCPGTVDILSADFSRDDLLGKIFSAVGLGDKYHPKSGPGPTVTAFWMGQGGCIHSPFNVTTDPQWEAFKTALSNTPKSVTEVKVNVSWNELKRWKPQDESDDELDEGTQVPNMERFTNGDHVLADTILMIKNVKKWKCSKRIHETCVDMRGSHITINRHRMNDWAGRIKASHGALSPEDPPPDDLLDRWGFRETPNPPARGRTGPYAQPLPQATSAAQDQTSLLMTALIATVADRIIGRQSPSPESSRKRRRESPSPPPVGQELRVFLTSCAEKLGISQDTMDTTIGLLRGECYTIEALGHKDYDRDGIMQLTGLPKGAVESIHALADDWWASREEMFILPPLIEESASNLGVLLSWHSSNFLVSCSCNTNTNN